MNRFKLNSIPSLSRLLIFTSLSATLSLVLLSSGAFAGDKGGNGGGAHVCYTDETHKTMVPGYQQTYDLWEGINVHQLNIAPWDGVSTKEQIREKMLERIEKTQPGVAREMRNALHQLETKVKVVDAEKFTLQLVNDAYLILTGKNCVYKQMVNWLDNGNPIDPSRNVILREEAFYTTFLDPQNQAALDLHEAAYKVYRTLDPTQFEKTGSQPIRKFIAEVFSDSDLETQLDPKSTLDDKVTIKDGYINIATSDLSCSPEKIEVETTYKEGPWKKLVTQSPSPVSEVISLGETRSASLYKEHDSRFSIFRSGAMIFHSNKSGTAEFTIKGCGINPISQSRRIYSLSGASIVVRYTRTNLFMD